MRLSENLKKILKDTVPPFSHPLDFLRPQWNRMNRRKTLISPKHPNPLHSVLPAR